MPKIGDTLRVAYPQHAVIVEGRVANPAPMQTLVREVQIVSQKNFSITYSSAEMALDIEDFAARYIDQQVRDMAAKVENDILSRAYQATAFQTGVPTGAWTKLAYANIAKKYMEDAGSSAATKRMLINSTSETSIVPALAGLFNSQQQIKIGYEEGAMGRASGFDWAATSVMPTHTRGSANASYVINGANQTGSSIAINTGSGTFTVGDVVTFVGCYAVHPQTKVNLGYLRQFTVTEALAAAGNLQIYPAITLTGSEQNVNASPTNGGAVVIQGTASSTYGINLAYQEDAFTFVTVPLPDLPGLPCSRRKWKNISMRVATGSDITNDVSTMRFDIMYGFGALRPEWACRVANDPANLTPA